jgi:hypothetical protein
MQLEANFNFTDSLYLQDERYTRARARYGSLGAHIFPIFFKMPEQLGSCGVERTKGARGARSESQPCVGVWNRARTAPPSAGRDGADVLRDAVAVSPKTRSRLTAAADREAVVGEELEERVLIHFREHPAIEIVRPVRRHRPVLKENRNKDVGALMVVRRARLRIAPAHDGLSRHAGRRRAPSRAGGDEQIQARLDLLQARLELLQDRLDLLQARLELLLPRLELLLPRLDLLHVRLDLLQARLELLLPRLELLLPRLELLHVRLELLLPRLDLLHVRLELLLPRIEVVEALYDGGVARVKLRAGRRVRGGHCE